MEEEAPPPPTPAQARASPRDSPEVGASPAHMGGGVLGPRTCLGRGGGGFPRPRMKGGPETIPAVRDRDRACDSPLRCGFLSPVGGKARLVGRPDPTPAQPGSPRWQSTSSGSLELCTSGGLVGFFLQDQRGHKLSCGPRVRRGEQAPDSDVLTCACLLPGPQFPEL